jgi:hypothetical protein
VLNVFARTLASNIRIPPSAWISVFLLCRPRNWDGLINRSKNPTKFRRDSYFQKLILKWNRPNTLISKAEEERVVTFTTPAALHRVKSHRYPSGRRQGGLQRQSDCGGEQKNRCPCPVEQPVFSCHTLSELPRFTYYNRTAVVQIASSHFTDILWHLNVEPCCICTG